MSLGSPQHDRAARRSRSVGESGRLALIRALAQAGPLAAMDACGYVSDLRHNLVEGVTLADLEADFRQGSGQELRTKFRAAYSSSALAANVFARFKEKPESLLLADRQGFTRLAFEQRCPLGLPGGAPNLDVVASGPEGVIAVESKCLEHLHSHTARAVSTYSEPPSHPGPL